MLLSDTLFITSDETDAGLPMKNGAASVLSGEQNRGREPASQFWRNFPGLRRRFLAVLLLTVSCIALGFPDRVAFVLAEELPLNVVPPLQVRPKPVGIARVQLNENLAKSDDAVTSGGLPDASRFPTLSSDDDYEIAPSPTDEVQTIMMAVAPVRQLGPAVSQFNQIVFGGYSGDVFAAAGHQMEFLLQSKLTTTDQICSLTMEQKQKLQLAGRGDIKRLIEEMRTQRDQCERVDKAGPGPVPDELTASARVLRTRLESGPFGKDSVFAKTLAKILTGDQFAQSESYLALEKLGGRMHLRPHGEEEIKALRMTKATLTDEGMAPIARITGLKSLNLDYTQVTDEGLVHLQNLTTLEILEMEGTRIHGQGLAHLQDLQSLKVLDLRRCKLDDAGLKCLPKLASLNVLQLSHTQISGGCLSHLAEFPSLEVLILVQTSVGDAPLEGLAGLTHLREINLEGTAVTDAGMPHLAKLTGLETLDLRRTRVTDAGLRHLKGMLKLRAVYLFGTQVTAEGAAAMERELPGTRIVR